MNPLLGTMLNNNPMMQNIGAIKNLMNCRNPSDVMREMLKNNPRFSQFVNENKCLTPEQIAQKYPYFSKSRRCGENFSLFFANSMVFSIKSVKTKKPASAKRADRQKNTALRDGGFFIIFTFCVSSLRSE